MIQFFKNKYHKFQALIANIRYGFPARELTLIGVTGTDGKTTTVSMIYHILKYSKIKVGMISTIEVKIGDKSLDSGLHVTTPDPWDVPRYLSLMKKQGITHVVIESTSSGLDQNRLAYINFDSAAITNIREDHLDYHKTWERYAAAKFRLIEQVKDKGLVVLNDDDEKSASWILARSQRLRKEIYAKWFSKKDIFNARMSVEGLEFDYENTHFKVPMIGEHNFENVGQVINICRRYVEFDIIQKALTSFSSPLGRMQLMQSRPYSIIVDFAHTPNALEHALESVLQLKENKDDRVISVFGCAGQRDKGRRRMGQVSATMADITILTAEDPRDEDLGLVNNDILRHGEKAGAVLIDRFSNSKMYKSAPIEIITQKILNALQSGKKPFILFDENTPRSREDAIEFALRIAGRGDIVFITGKGHEKSLAFGDPIKEYPWSDQETVKEKLQELVVEA